MRLTVGYLSIFVSDWRRLGLDDEDLRALELAVMENPSAGRIIPGAGGLRKMRFAPIGWGRGKSGGTRVCYVYFARHDSVFMLAAYSKNEQENITAADKARYRRMIQSIEAGIAGRGRGT
jgi:hypothetical protein